MLTHLVVFLLGWFFLAVITAKVLAVALRRAPVPALCAVLEMELDEPREVEAPEHYSLPALAR